MGSTLRNDTSAAIFLERLAKAWDKRRDLTFGELLYEVLQEDDQFVGVDDETAIDSHMRVALKLRRLKDTQIAEAVERFVLTR